jgi:hypothetical protein
MNVRAIGIWGLAITAALLCRPAPAEPPARQGAAASQPGRPGRLGAAPPGTHGVPGTPPTLRPEEIERRISAEEREKLGLPEPDWVAKYGKVHPDVRAILETGQMPWKRFKGWEPIGFEGTAYVAVYLRREKKDGETPTAMRGDVKRLQTLVLTHLLASEFYVWYEFESTPGILGFVTAAGLERLTKDPDVTAVALDDRPPPERPTPIISDDLPPATAGDPATQPAHGRFWGSGGKVEADVYRALALHHRVYVTSAIDQAAIEDEDERMPGWARQVEDAVLSRLTANEFWVWSRTGIHSRGGPRIRGLVNAKGLQKLVSCPELTAVALNRRLEGAPR